MGRKVHPTCFRLGIIKDWEARWYAERREFGDLLAEDRMIRQIITEELPRAGVSRVEIERFPRQVSLAVHPKPVAGKGITVFVALRNLADTPVGLGSAEEVFAWLVIVYDRQRAYLTGRIRLPAGVRWPASLAGGKTIALPPVTLTDLAVYRYADRSDILKTYLGARNQTQLPSPANDVIGDTTLLITLSVNGPHLSFSEPFDRIDNHLLFFRWLK